MCIYFVSKLLSGCVLIRVHCRVEFVGMINNLSVVLRLIGKKSILENTIYGKGVGV